MRLRGFVRVVSCLANIAAPASQFDHFVGIADAGLKPTLLDDVLESRKETEAIVCEI